MDDLGTLFIIGLVLLTIPVLGLVGFIRTLVQSRRLADLEQTVRRLEAQLAAGRLPPRSVQEGTSPDPAASATDEGPAAPLPTEFQPSVDAAGLSGAGATPDAPAGPSPSEPEPDDLPPPLPPVPPRLAPAAPPRSLEETIGTRWVVWVGGVALGLGGLFLVRYSIEQGWFGPGARIAAGVLFAAALAAAGEMLRRRERRQGLPAVGTVPGAHIPSILTAAGTLTAFGTVYAAHALYGMVGPAVAFVLLALLGLATMAAAALHGPALAGFGLLASFVAPMLVSSSDPRPWPVVLYLVAVTGAAYGLARLRLWSWLALAAAGGAAFWALLFMGMAGHAPEAATHIAIQAAIAVALLVLSPHRNSPDDAPKDGLATGILVLFAVLATIALGPDLYLGSARVPFAAVMLVLIGGAALRVPAAAEGLLAALLSSAAALAFWPVLAELEAETVTAFPAPGQTGPLPDTLWLFLTAGAGAGAFALAGSLLRLARSPALPRIAAGFYAAAGVIGPLALLLIAWWRVAFLDRSIPFAVAAGGLGVLFVLSAGELKRRFAESGHLAARYGIEAFAAGAIGALALGLTIALDKGALTVALALSAVGAAWVTTREPLGLLRFVIGALGIAVAARLAWNPSVVAGDLGSTPVFNWLLWGYGVPALSFGAASVMLRRQADDQVVALCEALAVAFGGFLVVFEIRHALSGGAIDSLNAGHLEVGLQAFAALMMAVVLVSLEVTRRSVVIRVATYLFGGLGLGAAVLGLALVNNPLFNGASEAVVGGTLFNSLLAAYLLPALAAVVLARRAVGLRPAWFVLAARSLAAALGVAWLTLEIRRFFQGPVLSAWHGMSDAEAYTYSAVFLLVGLALLVVGLWRGSREARYGSAAFILVAVLKAFLYDMAGLTGAWRALSFIGLGLVLMGIGLVYQKLVFRPQPGPPSGSDGPEGAGNGTAGSEAPPAA